MRKVRKRMKILLRIRMIMDLLLITQVMRNQMLVIGVVKKRNHPRRKQSSSKPVQKRKPKGRDDEGQEKKKAKKKKDPNAPKRATAPFLYFAMAERGVKRSSLTSSRPRSTRNVMKKNTLSIVVKLLHRQLFAIG